MEITGLQERSIVKWGPNKRKSAPAASAREA
jgi:hypothetical protein